VDSIADALTIGTANNLRIFEVGNGSTITLAATLANKVMEGHEWTLALGSQNVASSMFIDAAVSGTGTGSESEYEDCIFGVTSLPPMQAYNSSFTATTSGGFTMSTAGDYRFINCQSGVAGSSSPLFTAATAAITAEFRRWSGGITFAGLTSDDTITIGGEMGTIDLGSPVSAVTVEVRGTYKAITNIGSASINVNGALKGGAGQYDGKIHFDSNNGVDGTVAYLNGTSTNPVSVVASAQTLASSVNLYNYKVANASTVTLTGTSSNETWEGHEWNLALGGQNIASSMFIDASVTGTATGSDAEFETCEFGISSLAPAHFHACSFSATTSAGCTLSTAGDYRFINCQSGVAGASSPLFTFATAAITAEFRRWSGGITFAGLTSDDTITVGGEMGTIDLGSPVSAVNVQIRGTYKAITNIGSASVNLDGAILAADVAAILVDTGTTIPALIGTPAADVSADIAAVKVDTGNLVTRITSTLFTGITSLAEWLGLMAGDQAADATALAEIKTSGAGSGTYDSTTDSLEAIAGAGGGGAPTAAQVADAVWDETQSTHVTAGSFGEIATEVAAILTDTGTTIPATITTAQNDLDIITGASGVNLLTATQASIDAIEADTNELQSDDVPGLIAALNNLSSADVLTTALTESYGTDGSAHTLSQLLYLVNAAVSEFAISSTTKTTKKLDGSTTAATYTLDDATSPTSITRAT
jgi:hypothetical protein